MIAMNINAVSPPPSVLTESKTQSRFSRLGNSFHQIARNLDDLEAQLEPVTDSSPRPQAISEGVKPDGNSPTACGMAEMENIAGCLAQRVRDLINRIDL